MTNDLETHNHAAAEAHERSLDATRSVLAQRGVDVDQVIDRIQTFEVAVPSWALQTGGTRFGRFPIEGEPRNVYEKLEDVSVIHRLTRATPRVSLHIPWDEPDDVDRLKSHADDLGLGFDAVNSNTFQDQEGQEHSYKFGSFSHTDPGVRQQAVEHNLHVVELGEALGSEAITIWLADGSNYPGQMHLRKSFDRVLRGLNEVYDALPVGWRLYTEHKPYEPAFYATVVQDWGSSLMLANRLGPQAQCLVDLGHHLPNANIELVVARLLTAGKLGGFHFNDSKYGDDDLTTGSIQPYQLFLVFNELVDAEEEALENFNPDYMIDQSHNVKDPIEAFLQTADQLQTAYAKAVLVDREALTEYQQANDVLRAEETLKQAYQTDVSPLVAEARRRQGGAIDPVTTFRNSGYRATTRQERTGEGYSPPQSL
jgi:L-rhamnose isomerase/sugar isomerase